jgi:hypothetical protein
MDTTEYTLLNIQRGERRKRGRGESEEEEERRGEEGPQATGEAGHPGPLRLTALPDFATAAKSSPTPALHDDML